MPRKPTIPGKNRVRNVHKAFRSHGGLNHLICCTYKTMIKEGDKLLNSDRWKREHANREEMDNFLAGGVARV